MTKWWFPQCLHIYTKGHYLHNHRMNFCHFVILFTSLPLNCRIWDSKLPNKGKSDLNPNVLLTTVWCFLGAQLQLKWPPLYIPSLSCWNFSQSIYDHLTCYTFICLFKFTLSLLGCKPNEMRHFVLSPALSLTLRTDHSDYHFKNTCCVKE